MPDPSPVTFGGWLRLRRKYLDLTQAALADQVGCSVAAIKKIEAGDRRPSRQVAALLARSLRLPEAQQAAFVRVARGELPVERLPAAAGVTGSPAGASAPAVQHTLPTPANALIGREVELAALARLLMDPRCRLATLTGPGGSGKTRLSLEAAHSLQPAFAHGAAFAPLAGLAAGAGLATAIAEALRFTFHGGEAPLRQLCDYLHDKHLLLVLDNLEHLLDDPATAQFVEAVLQAAPRVTALATSREPLRVAGEWVLEIQGLPVPVGPDGAETSSAMALFAERARQARADWSPDEAERAAAARICRLVDGMPLGIELAAAWVPALSAAEIADEIERGLDFLAAPGRGMPERHRSLRAVFDHSWKLLTPEARAALARLAVFRGGFTRAAAEAVAGAALPSLSALAGQSLLRRGAAGRFDLHELVRQYAAERLGEAESATRDRHAAYTFGLWRAREAALKGAGQLDALRELSAERDNLRAAWAWALQTGQLDVSDAAWPALWAFYEMRGGFAEGGALFEQAVQAARDGPSPLRLGRALTYLGWFQMRLGRFAQAHALFDEALARLRPAGDPAAESSAALFMGILKYVSGEWQAAWEWLTEARALAERLGDRWLAAQALINQQGAAGALTGRWSEAYAGMQAALDAMQALGDVRTRVTALNFYVAPLAMALGDYAGLRRPLEEALAFFEQAGDAWGLALTYANLGRVAQAQGDFAEARRLLERGLALHAELGARADVAFSRLRLGQLEAAAGEGDQAEVHLRAALRLGMEVNALPTALEAAGALAQLWAGRDGAAGRALELGLRVMRHPACPAELRAALEPLCRDLADRLGPEQAETVQAHASAEDFASAVRRLSGDALRTE